MKIRIDGKAFSLDPQKAIGKGGEADVYSLGNGAALKIYKTPDHPDFGNDPEMNHHTLRTPCAIPERRRSTFTA